VDESRDEQIKGAVKAYYGARAAEVVPSCCGPEPCCGEANVEVEAAAATETDSRCCADAGTVSSLGCGDPLAFVEFQEGQVVLDLGSGFGMEAILAAQMVGESGKVIGLDLTPEMIDKAKKNAERAGVEHIAEFRLGEMEEMPVDNESVDWIISNCVVNLSPDKDRVFQEAYRVLKPGGKMVISDLVSSDLPEEVKRDLTSWAQCLGGTVEEAEYLGLMRSAGFDEVGVVDRFDASAALLGSTCCGPAPDATNGPKIESIRVSATKTTGG
jgi:SAM-dependent methyltransferase